MNHPIQTYPIKPIKFDLLSLLIILMVLYIPFAGIGDLLKSFTLLQTQGAAGNRVERSDPLSLLFLYGREAILGIVYFLFLLRTSLKGYKIIKLFFLPFVILVILTSAEISLVNYPLIVFISGLRGLEYFPLILILPLIFKHPKSYRWLNNSIQILILIELFACLIQTQLMPETEGATFLGARTIGTFNNPNTIGIFFSITLYWVLFIKKTQKAGFWMFCCILGILTTGSRTAVLGVTAVIFLFIQKNIKSSSLKAMFFFISILMGLLILINLNLFAGRSLYETNSNYLTTLTTGGEGRVDIYKNLSELFTPKYFLFGKGIGVGTNTLWSFLGDDAISISNISESMFISGVCQFGFFGYTIIQLFLFSISKRIGAAGTTLFLLQLIVSLSNSWFEMYPFNLLLALAYGLLLRHQRERKMRLSHENTSRRSSLLPGDYIRGFDYSRPNTQSISS